MTARKLIETVVVLALIAGGGVLGGMTVKDVSKLREINESIRVQQEIQRNIQEEKGALVADLKRTGERMQEIPDSLGSARGPAMIRESMNYAKSEQILDGKAMRAERMLAHFETERAEVMDHLKRWGVRLGALELVLVGLVIVLRRTGS